MAEPGDPKDTRPTQAPDHDHDAHIGFVSPASLAGRARAEPEPVVEPEREVVRAADREPDLFDAPEPKPEQRPEPVTPVFAAPEPTPVAPAVQPEPVREDAYRTIPRRQAETAPAPRLGLGLYAVYALILFAVPTFGVSALVGLLAVTGRDGPSEPLAANHFIYQQRTLWITAVTALLGAILVVVNVGVFVLFVLAVWVLLRGAYGVLTLKAGKPIRDPRSWLF